MGRFVNPFTDVGFKIVFGQEISKPLLLHFLNTLLEGVEEIVDLSFSDKEQVADYDDDRTLIYDVLCTRTWLSVHIYNGSVADIHTLRYRYGGVDCWRLSAQDICRASWYGSLRRTYEGYVDIRILANFCNVCSALGKYFGLVALHNYWSCRRRTSGLVG